jgi:hypothetical protein
MAAQAVPETTEELVQLGDEKLEQDKTASETSPGTEDCTRFCCSYVGQRWNLYCGGVYRGTFTCPDTRCYYWCCS